MADTKKLTPDKTIKLARTFVDQSMKVQGAEANQLKRKAYDTFK